MATPTHLYVYNGTGEIYSYVGEYANISASVPGGYHFREWVGSKVSFVNRLAANTSVRLDGSPTCSATAYFDADPPPPSYWVYFYAGAGGTLTGDVDQYGTAGTAITLVTAVPNPGFIFTRWDDGLEIKGRTGTIPGSASYTASFTSSMGSPVSTSPYMMF